MDLKKMENKQGKAKEKYVFKPVRLVILVFIQIIMAVLAVCSIQYLQPFFRYIGVDGDVGPLVALTFFVVALVATILCARFVSHWKREYLMASFIILALWAIIGVFTIVTIKPFSLDFLGTISVIIAICLYALFQVFVVAIMNRIRRGSN
jgi:hypothetical protein